MRYTVRSEQVLPDINAMIMCGVILFFSTCEIAHLKVPMALAELRCRFLNYFMATMPEVQRGPHDFPSQLNIESAQKKFKIISLCNSLKVHLKLCIPSSNHFLSSFKRSTALSEGKYEHKIQSIMLEGDRCQSRYREDLFKAYSAVHDRENYCTPHKYHLYRQLVCRVRASLQSFGHLAVYPPAIAHQQYRPGERCGAPIPNVHPG